MSQATPWVGGQSDGCAGGEDPSCAERRGDIVRTVFAVDQQPVIAALSHDFGDIGRGEGDQRPRWN